MFYIDIDIYINIYPTVYSSNYLYIPKSNGLLFFVIEAKTNANFRKATKLFVFFLLRDSP